MVIARRGLMACGIIFFALAFSALSLWGSPVQPPELPPGITAAERAAAVQVKLDQTWQRLVGAGGSIDQPIVEIVRYSTHDDQFRTYAECMTRAGYPSSYVVSEGVVTQSAPHTDSSQFALAQYTCEAQYPLDPVDLGLLTAGQAAYLERYWTGYLTPCLRGVGVDLPEVPRATALAPGSGSIASSWEPYRQVREMSGNVVARAVFERCPPYPRGFRASEYIPQ